MFGYLYDDADNAPMNDSCLDMLKMMEENYRIKVAKNEESRSGKADQDKDGDQS